MNWQEVGVGSGSNIEPGTSQFRGGRWWHHQVGTGKLFAHVGLGDACPPGCEQHTVDGQDICVTPDGDPCGAAPNKRTPSEFIDCGSAGDPFWQNGKWNCPQSPGCQPGQVLRNGVCVGAGIKTPTNVHNCAANENWNPTTKKCQAIPLTDNDCADNELVDRGTLKCAPMCADGNAQTNGQCPGPPPAPAPVIKQCPQGQGLNTKGECVPAAPANPPSLSTPSNVMPWLIGLGLLAGVGTLAYLANKNHPKTPGTPGARGPKFNFKRTRRLRRLGRK